jgi:hypothetical protein
MSRDDVVGRPPIAMQWSPNGRRLLMLLMSAAYGGAHLLHHAGPRDLAASTWFDACRCTCAMLARSTCHTTMEAYEGAEFAYKLVFSRPFVCIAGPQGVQMVQWVVWDLLPYNTQSYTVCEKHHAPQVPITGANAVTNSSCIRHATAIVMLFAIQCR